MRRLSASRKNISALDNITVDKLVELSSLPNLDAMAFLAISISLRNGELPYAALE